MGLIGRGVYLGFGCGALARIAFELALEAALDCGVRRWRAVWDPHSALEASALMSALCAVGVSRVDCIGVSCPDCICDRSVGGGAVGVSRVECIGVSRLITSVAVAATARGLKLGGWMLSIGPKTFAASVDHSREFGPPGFQR